MDDNKKVHELTQTRKELAFEKEKKENGRQN